MRVNDVRPPSGTARPGLDEVDREILRLLAEDARLPNNAIADRVGVAPSTCHARIRALRESGVIRGYHADVAPEALGRPLQAIVVVRLQAQARTRIREFAHYLCTLPGVLNVYFLAGADDFQVHVASESTDTLRDFVVDNLSASTDVAMTETHLIFEHISLTHSLH